MSNKTLDLSESLYTYLQETSLREPKSLFDLREETARLGRMAVMQICPEQGQFMSMLVELIGARKILEVGTFTGYSTLCCALAMPDDGKLIACDVSEEWTAIARKYWKTAKVDHKIDLVLAPARHTLEELLDSGHNETFDMVFIDADKVNYDTYYELALKLLRPGGLVMIDNVLWGGAVADPQDHDADTEAIRTLNTKLLQDKRVTLSMLPVGDGLTLARKR